MKRPLLWLPLLAFVALLGVVANGLFRPADRVVRSALIGQPLPSFALPPMVPGKPGLTTQDFNRGEPRLLNVFASWCVPCIAEAPQLMALKQAGVPIDAIAIRDTDLAIRAFLQRNGDPFARVGGDPNSQVQLALGSSGVPESFVIDGKGRIVLQHVGAIENADVPRIIAAVRNAR
ncbi:DsbE family thiol:disulfide interchange protein [Sphingomonas radiodurans]|uniref:DsbE family thiol:disulfide interchange protein n=1 Tax=Sphingomonas radiodurans TaxID=2890321 RepID=UPI001E34F1B8|nr:DsbE family thiol:disulfide interchange protein [Sphingomonas radiodurans]WBH15560.1 DsbE family thiol:disulfide interchange protein [Sphingomonas radiodurans]